MPAFDEALIAYERGLLRDPTEPGPLARLLHVERAAQAWSFPERLEWHRCFARRFGQVRSHVQLRPLADVKHRPIRIGYLACTDAARQDRLERLLDHHDQEAFEVFLYRTGRATGRATATTHRDLEGQTDRAAAERIAADRLDLLAVLDGHGPGSRLGVAAYRPASVLVSLFDGPLAFCGIDHRVDLSEPAELECRLRELAVAGRRPIAGARIVATDSGAELVVPDSLDTVSTFVMVEQRRWFEDEVGFVRALLGPDEVVVDVGANFGAYTIEAARLVGPGGRVVSFEPSSTTAALLGAAVTHNDLTNVLVHQVALGADRGRATLVLGASPELAYVGRGEGPGEEVRLAPLHAFADELSGMSFLKLDAEGSEEAILHGSADLIRREAPLVMFELRHGAEVNRGLLDTFRELGFGLYQLCPSLKGLVPFAAADLDDFVLNLFAATEARAEILEGRGLLTRRVGRAAPASDPEVAAWSGSRPLLTALGLAAGSQATEALRLWITSRREDLPLSHRYGSLRAALDRSLAELNRAPTVEARLTAGRIALDLGRRITGLDAIIPLVDRARPTAPLQVPFACPIARYEELGGFDAAQIMVAQSIEARLRFGAFSSFYEPSDVFELIDQFYAAGGSSPEMDRRLGLLLAKWHRRGGRGVAPVDATR